MNCAIVQPPFVQLNTVYPAAWYLESFLAGAGHEARAFDHSIETFGSIFSREGLERVFEDAEIAWKTMSARADESTRSQVARYFSSRRLYVDWIDGIMAFLCGRDPGFAHRLAGAAERPSGFKTERWLESVGGNPDPSDARILATRILEDMADFIVCVLDPDFGTVRYAERLASGIVDFGILESRLKSSYIMEVFYRPLLRDFIESQSGAHVFLVTIPFPGCLVGALCLAAEIRRLRGKDMPILFGGGYISTELRTLADPGIFDYCDFLCFDSGYAALESVLDFLRGGRSSEKRSSLRQLMYREASGEIRRCSIDDGPAHPPADPAGYREDALPAKGSLSRTIAVTFPDYSRLDFGKYLRVADSSNPMHRLWSDSPWLKFHLAHGCYWQRCSFCDTSLDYVAHFVPSDMEALVAACARSAEATGLYGIHFVDEAMPVGRLLAFAEANRRRAMAGRRPFHFWGNVRFDASWTAERCELLAVSGLVAVSGGIEIASESGLAMTDKGFDLSGLVRCLVGMKSAGLLVHAYLIYGFPAQTEFQIVESAEIVRQAFACGLVDSAFWHRFVLTRHSRMYAEWKAGRMPALDPDDAPRAFADNDLSFSGSARFDRFDDPVRASLAAWMEGESLEIPVWQWFPGFPGKDRPLLPRPDLVETLIGAAQAGIDSSLFRRHRNKDLARIGRQGFRFTRPRCPLPPEKRSARLIPAFSGRAVAPSPPYSFRPHQPDASLLR
jgi:radical SAM superfamily enzyme YgiQ (UPF0313 family)